MARVWREFNVMNPTPEEAYMLDRGITGMYVNEPDPVPPPARRPIVAAPAAAPATRGQQIVRDIYGGTPSTPSQYVRNSYANAPAPRRAKAAAPRRPAARPAPRPAAPTPVPTPAPILTAPVISATPFSDSLQAQGMQPDSDRIASATQHAYDLQRVFGDIPSALVYEMQQAFDNVPPAPVITAPVPPIATVPPAPVAVVPSSPIPRPTNSTPAPVVQAPVSASSGAYPQSVTPQINYGANDFVRQNGQPAVPSTPAPIVQSPIDYGAMDMLREDRLAYDNAAPAASEPGFFDYVLNFLQTNPGIEEAGAWD